MGRILTAKIDVKKLDKSRFFQGKPDPSGHAPLWADIVLVERKEPSRYGATHFIKQSATKEERANKVELPIIGEATERGGDGGKSQGAPARENSSPLPARREPSKPAAQENLDEDVPF